MDSDYGIGGARECSSRSETGNGEVWALVHALPRNFMTPVRMWVDFLFCWATAVNRPLSCPVFTIPRTPHLKLWQFPPRETLHNTMVSWEELSL